MQKNNTTVKAINKNVRSSPRKLALVLNYIKGKKADIAIGAGGTVTWERISCLLPSIVITTAENQILPIKELANIGIIYYLGHRCQDFVVKMTKVFKDIISGKFNKKIFFDNNIVEVDGLGAKRVANFLTRMS